MAANVSAEEFVARLEPLRSPQQAGAYRRAFKPGEDDVFIGVRMGQVFTLAKELMGMQPAEIERLLESPVHEVRVGAVSIMDWQARSKKTPAQRRQELFDLYLRRHDRINTWDLVDRSAPYVVGSYLFDRPRDILYDLACSTNIWERRTAMVSTFYFIRKGDIEDTIRVAEILLSDDQDLIHKATGWGLREVGKQERGRLLAFLDEHGSTMPRTALRYAIEHLDKEQREHYLGLKRAS
ncbi:MAG: DNA alkylation repair protein [Dehalococcoidia bacterium]